MTKALATLFSALLLAGCTNRGSDLGKSPVQSPVQPNPQPRLARDVKVRIRELSSMLDQFDVDLRELPARTDADDRRVTARLLGDLTEILPTLIGPDLSASSRQQVAIIDSARAQLLGGSPNLSAEPNQDTALRATYNALAALQRNQFYNHQEIEKLLTDLQVTLASLDTVRGPLHRSNVKDAMTQIGRILQQMFGILDARIANRA